MLRAMYILPFVNTYYFIVFEELFLILSTYGDFEDVESGKKFKGRKQLKGMNDNIQKKTAICLFTNYY